MQWQGPFARVKERAPVPHGTYTYDGWWVPCSGPGIRVRESGEGAAGEKSLQRAWRP